MKAKLHFYAYILAKYGKTMLCPNIQNKTYFSTKVTSLFTLYYLFVKASVAV